MYLKEYSSTAFFGCFRKCYPPFQKQRHTWAVATMPSLSIQPQDIWPGKEQCQVPVLQESELPAI